MSPATAVAGPIAAATASVALGAYLLDSTLGVSIDIRGIREDKKREKWFGERIERLGDRVNLYHSLELAIPEADAFWFGGRSWNYAAMKTEVDALALSYRAIGVVDKDMVAVFMTNSPEMVFSLYALSKLGATVALLNSALRDDTLAHCIKVPQASHIISTPDLALFAARAAESLDGTIETYSVNRGSFVPWFVATDTVNVKDLPIIDAATATPVIPPRASPNDFGLLIYTSGTTGKPKACAIKNGRLAGGSVVLANDLVNPKKYLSPLRTYSCMPLFHGTTLFVGLCYSVGASGCFCLARKFSVRNFWKDVSQSRATKILYVGELCRYLLKAPPGEYDRKHQCIVAMGNGLQKDVWLPFMKRFGVPEVREFYRSTEGYAKFDNQHFGSRRGAGKVGFQGVYRRQLEKDQFIVKFDYDNEMPYRDPKTGYCVFAAPNEPGEVIARIKNMALYPEYVGNTQATEAKIMRDVFAKGDLWQRSGDLLRQDRLGWVTFVDRIGDTFRWKGENVSAGEVRAFISEMQHVLDVVVVEKQLKGYDGQTGAAFISLDGSSGGEIEERFIKGLYRALRKMGLPGYALPRLVAVTNELAAVGDTFKHAKQSVKSLDWSPDASDSGMRKYWLDSEAQTYKPIDAKSWATIETGQAKL